MSYAQASKDQCWVDAMSEEIAAMHSNQTWTIVPKPIDRNVVGSKWVYKMKYRADGSIERYKARLVAKGYTQAYGIDYQEIFSLVVKMVTVHTVLAIALGQGWPLYHLDVKNTFLHGELQEEVYMEQPPGFAEQDSSLYVCKLQRSI